MKKIIIVIASMFLSVQIFAQIDTVQSLQKINNIYGGFSGDTLSEGDLFGRVVKVIGDVNWDGIDDIAVSAHKDDDGATDRGAVYILMLNEDGTVKDQQKISETAGNGPSFTTGHKFFGTGIAALGDLNGDGKVDIAVGGGACDDDGVSAFKGAVYILFLDTNGMVLEYQKISNTQGGGPGSLATQDLFGTGVSNIGDLNQDGLPEIAIFTQGDDDGGVNVGAVFIGFLDYDGTLKDIQKISATDGGFGGALTAGDQFGLAEAIGDLDNDGVIDIAISAPNDDDGGTDRGAVWICFMTDSGYVKSEQKISDTVGSFTGTLDDSDKFGLSLCSVGDLNNDTTIDLAVTAVGDDDGGTNRGAIWFLMLDTDGTVKSYDKVNTTDTLLVDTVVGGDDFSCGISSFGDRNGDGQIDLLVGARNAADTSRATGEVYVIHFDADTTYPHRDFHQTTAYINTIVKQSAASSPLDGELGLSDGYGISISNIGDLDGDGIDDMAVGAHSDDDGGGNKGAIYINFMNSNGAIKSQQKISDTRGGFNGYLYSGGSFGSAVAGIGDVNGDGIPDIAVGAISADDGGTDRGEVWILFMT
ncbi:MAG: FG-GAP repeat protein, partial [Flavobacteriales bacterium]|nr:FG-GAP repeat protein [Flavobacteriales bacterium]